MLLPNESHQTLSWIFEHLEIPMLIASQSAGELLQVPNIGTFSVEWHLSADLKALDCMFGVAGGANARHPCLYCMESPAKVDGWSGNSINGYRPPTRDKKKLVQSTLNPPSPPRKGQRKRAKISVEQPIEPGAVEWVLEDPNWKPILLIPLERVHVCTLHAEIRILDKLLRMHIDYAYSNNEASIDECETLLSSMGFHGGDVHIKKDNEQSGGTRDVPVDVCMGGSNHDDSCPTMMVGKRKLYGSVGKICVNVQQMKQMT